jgi:hypothetical protein
MAQPQAPEGSSMAQDLPGRALVRLAAVLLIAAGPLSHAAADGLPGEYLLSTRWRDLLSWHSPVTNPAFLPWEQVVTVRGAFAPTMQGAFHLWELGATVPLPLSQAVGATLVGESDGRIESSVFDEATGQLAPGDNSVSNSNFFIMISYAKEFLQRLSFGANVNIAYQSNFGDGVGGAGLDLGCVYRFRPHPRLGNQPDRAPAARRRGVLARPPPLVGVRLP